MDRLPDSKQVKAEVARVEKVYDEDLDRLSDADCHVLVCGTAYEAAVDVLDLFKELFGTQCRKGA